MTFLSTFNRKLVVIAVGFGLVFAAHAEAKAATTGGMQCAGALPVEVGRSPKAIQIQSFSLAATGNAMTVTTVQASPLLAAAAKQHTALASCLLTLNQAVTLPEASFPISAFDMTNVTVSATAGEEEQFTLNFTKLRLDGPSSTPNPGVGGVLPNGGTEKAKPTPSPTPK
jgi:hypothetical protein